MAQITYMAVKVERKTMPKNCPYYDVIETTALSKCVCVCGGGGGGGGGDTHRAHHNESVMRKAAQILHKEN